MNSNQYNFNTYLSLVTYNADSSHNITVEIGNKIFYEKHFIQGKEHRIKISDYFNYESAGKKQLKLTWNGDKESADKYLKIFRVIVNEQHIAPHTVLIEPYTNEYIERLKTSDNGKKFLKDKIFYPGHRHGWYGEYTFQFLVDPRDMRDQKEESLKNACGITSERVFSDESNQRYFRKAKKI